MSCFFSKEDYEKRSCIICKRHLEEGDNMLMNIHQHCQKKVETEIGMPMLYAAVWALNLNTCSTCRCTSDIFVGPLKINYLRIHIDYAHGGTPDTIVDDEKFLWQVCPDCLTKTKNGEATPREHFKKIGDVLPRITKINKLQFLNPSINRNCI